MKFILIYVTTAMMQGGLTTGAGTLNQAPRFDTLVECQAAMPVDPGWQCIQRSE